MIENIIMLFGMVFHAHTYKDLFHIQFNKHPHGGLFFPILCTYITSLFISHVMLDSISSHRCSLLHNLHTLCLYWYCILIGWGIPTRC